MITVNTLSASTAAQWRDWLAHHCRSEKEIWLVIHHKDSTTPSIGYHEAIEHALCYGWIDSHARTRRPGCSELRFTPRGPRSTWSRVNRQRAATMIERGLMTAHGQAAIDRARATGTWQVLTDAQSDAVPEDLGALLDRDEAARTHFAGFPPSSRRLILEWIATAKKPETRERRITRTVELAAVGIRANHPGTRMPARQGAKE
jgi:uncharacterized protein YdeI (YjbR/CyaY-like superfamily)